MPTLRLVVSSWFLAAVSLAAAEPVSEIGKAPAIREIESETRELGTWDDAFKVDDQDFLVLRRGEELFTLPMIGRVEPRKAQTAPSLAGTQIIAAATAGPRLWLLINSRNSSPFAFDLHSGTQASFDIPGLNVPGGQAPGIQSHVIALHVSAVLLQVAGGDRVTWPRDGNRPIYFWMDLRSGKVNRFPTGWDLEYFSSDMQLAVFAGVSDERRPVQAVELRTGERLEAVPDRRKEFYAPFDWSDRASVKALYARRPGEGDADFFAGLSYRGNALPIDMELNEVLYLAQAKVNDGFAAFRLRPSGSGSHEPSPLWLMPAEKPGKRRRVADDVADFVMLQRGNVVFSTSGHGPKRSSSEAWYHDHNGSATWNILDGVERLPPLDKELAGADFIEDRLFIRLETSFGDPKLAPLALSLATHQRGDRRAIALPMLLEGKRGRGKLLESELWRRALLVTSDGERYLTPDFRDGTLPDQFWLHHSGNLITGTHVWTGEDKQRIRQVELTRILLRFAREIDLPRPI